jgi:hypothetical protein
MKNHYKKVLITISDDSNPNAKEKDREIFSLKESIAMAELTLRHLGIKMQGRAMYALWSTPYRSKWRSWWMNPETQQEKLLELCPVLQQKKLKEALRKGVVHLTIRTNTRL